MKTRTTVLALWLVAFVVTAAPAWAQGICYGVAGNLVTNCGFETGDFTGWTLTGNTGSTGVTSSSPYVNSGNFGANLGLAASDGYLSQNVGANTHVYLVEFYLESDGGTPNDFTVYWNGLDVGPDLFYAPQFGYTLYSTFFAGNAGAGSNSLTFSYRQDPAYWGIDDVIVVGVVPEPGSLMLMGSGILGLAGVIRRKLRA